MGFSFSVENVMPTIWWRYGLNNYTDIGFKLGIPISGTGIDINRLLMKKERRWDMLNLAYSISPNSSLDLTYYMFKVHKKEKLSFLESLYLVVQNANENFKKNLWEKNEGKALALTYLKERGFDDEIINFFEIGYSLNEKSHYSNQAIKEGYSKKYLELIDCF